MAKGRTTQMAFVAFQRGTYLIRWNVYIKPCLVSHLAPDFSLCQLHAFNIGFNFDWRSSCLICKSHTLSVSLVDGQSNQANNSHRIVFVALLYISYPSYLVFIGLLNKWFHSLLHLIHLLQLCVGAGSSERSGWYSELSGFLKDVFSEKPIEPWTRLCPHCFEHPRVLPPSSWHILSALRSKRTESSSVNRLC